MLMEYILMVVIIIIIFPLAFLAAVKSRHFIKPEKRMPVIVIMALVALAIVMAVTFIKPLQALSVPITTGIAISACIGIILGFGGPFGKKRKK